METWKYQVQAVSVCSNFYFSLAMKQCISHWLFGFPNIFPGFVLRDFYCFVLFILWLVMFFFYACLNYMFPHSCIASCSPTISRNFWFTASLIVTLVKGCGDAGYWEGQPCCWEGMLSAERAAGDEGKLIENVCVVCARYFQLLTRMLAPVENHEAKGYQTSSNVMCDYILRNEKCGICFYLLIIAGCFLLCLSGSSTLLRWENWWPCILFCCQCFCHSVTNFWNMNGYRYV